jgi:hypothetical protein
VVLEGMGVGFEILVEGGTYKSPMEIPPLEMTDLADKYFFNCICFVRFKSLKLGGGREGILLLIVHQGKSYIFSCSAAFGTAKKY